ncbi:hypothetical protein A2U01_0095898, partial [Trifolium medium]|nr:hypothetical protein [Trifolium medium]
NTINRQHQSLVDGRHGKRWCGGPTTFVAPPPVYLHQNGGEEMVRLGRRERRGFCEAAL